MMTTTAGAARRRASGALWVAVVAMSAGYAFAAVAGSAAAIRVLPWVLGRGLGLASYLSLVGMTATGLWLVRAPQHRGRLAGPTLVWMHVWLAALTAVLVAGHVIALAMDSHVSIGWSGSLVPGTSGFKPLAIGLGTTGLYLGLLAVAAIGLSARLSRMPWLQLHRLGAASFVAVWFHGVLAGSDTEDLRPLYAATGLLLVMLWIGARVQGKP